MWFISLYVLAVVPVTSVKPAGTSPHVLESTYSVTEPLTFSGIRKILRTVALCVKQAGRDRYEIIFKVSPLYNPKNQHPTKLFSPLFHSNRSLPDAST